MTNLVFTYGTLKKGFDNHQYLQDSDFIGSGRTKEKYALYDRGIPFVIRNNPISYIYGEVYSVNDDVLAILDQLEGHPDWYYREVVEIVLNGDNNSVNAWLYFNPDDSGELITSGKYILK
ncbi:MAG: gamma-glutamylcyclotransferase family protein [Bacteroidota bacterium]